MTLKREEFRKTASFKFNLLWCPFCGGQLVYIGSSEKYICPHCDKEREQL